MASIRDDFIIAIRSAFLKKETKQKFSLLSLISLSIIIIILSSLDFKIINYTKIGINEVIYRSSYIASVPENFIKDNFIKINNHIVHYKKYKSLEEELDDLKSKDLTKKIITFENKELKKLIDDYLVSKNKVLAKVFLDNNSPFLKTIVINKGSKDNVKLGTLVFDKSYLVGKVIEVNYTNSRVLLLSDLNSKVPISIEPGAIQAIMSGSGKNYGKIKYVKSSNKKFIDKSVAFTSGSGGVFKSGIPVGEISINDAETDKEILMNIDFYSDFTQLKYVLVELTDNQNNQETKETNNEQSNSLLELDPQNNKLDLLLNQTKVLEELKLRLENENILLNENLINLKKDNLKNKKIIEELKKSLEKKEIDESEIEFLRLNLIYSSKCLKKPFNKKFKVGTIEYRNCILNKGKIN